tara:strand:+ start:112 stop:282 length:171 start_codon:yes stop_codon:yes gene_type:complete
MFPEAALAQRALKAGAAGYLMKQKAVETIATAAQKTSQDNVYVSQQMAPQIVAAFR